MSIEQPAATAAEYHTTPDDPLSRNQRRLRGRAARERAPRKSHAGWEPHPGRPDPVAVLEYQAL
jgi:hypothetical protein